MVTLHYAALTNGVPGKVIQFPSPTIGSLPLHMAAAPSVATRPNATSFDGHSGHVPTVAPLDKRRDMMRQSQTFLGVWGQET